MRRLAVWGCLLGGMLAAGAQPIKAVPQTERKLRPARLEELTPDQLRQASEASEEGAPREERSARGPRSARPPRGPRGGPPIRARIQPRT
jgi:hypothetical protein